MFRLLPCGKKTDKDTLRWVALGDSLTVGFGAPVEQSYPVLVAEKSYKSSVKLELVKNLADGGHTLARVQLMQMTRLSLYQPDIVSLWAGTNDAILNAALGRKFDLASQEALPTSFNSFQKRMNQVVEKLLKHSVQKIFIGTLHDFSVLPVAQDWSQEKKGEIKAIVAGYNRIFEQLAQKEKDVELVSLERVDELIDPTLYLNDGIHPKPRVYEAVAQAFWDVMHSSLKAL